jgi:hypothetical protein
MSTDVKDGRENENSISRRRALAAGAGAVALLSSSPNRAAGQAIFQRTVQTRATQITITSKDGTKIAYKDWGKGQPILFSHCWPLAGDVWEPQMLFFGQNGYRAIAHDRRGHGKSDQSWDGNNMDTYADDLAELIETLDLNDLVLVGHSTGGVEIVHYIGPIPGSWPARGSMTTTGRLRSSTAVPDGGMTRRRSCGVLLGTCLLFGDIDADSEAEYRRVFELMKQERADGLIVSSQGDFNPYSRLIIELAEQSRLPTIFPDGSFAKLGGLIGYGNDDVVAYR